MQMGLSQPVKESLELAADLARSTLEGWGHRALRERGVAIYA